MKRTIFTHHIKKYAKTIQGKSDNQLRGYMDGYMKALEIVSGTLLGLDPQIVAQDFQSKGYKYFFEEIAFAPYDYLRHLELSSWWGANIATWIMLVVLFGFFFYWVKQLIKFSKEGTERVDVTAHSFFK